MKNLIVNLGPSGDIVRTTVLLRELKGDIYWLSKTSCKDLLNSPSIKKVFFIENPSDMKELHALNFDLVLSLNEEAEALQIVKGLKKRRTIGVYLEGKKVLYTPESAYWFDMSLASVFGKKRADELKWVNRKSLPQILIEMIGKKWQEQEYDLGISGEKSNLSPKIGLIEVVTGKWPNKGWQGYRALAERLKKEKRKYVFLGLRPTLRDHINDLNKCDVVVCGDTLGAHIALALKKQVVVLFNCTSPWEIHGYDRMTKVISPLLEKYFYTKDYVEEATTAIKLDDVHTAIKDALAALEKYD